MPFIEKMRSQVNGIVIAEDMNGSIAEAPAEKILEAGFKSADAMQQVRRNIARFACNVSTRR